MTEPSVPNDPWLTVAEIAGELRVNPATVRLWITKELLPAKRAGRRKLLVRRSDLDAMLRAQEEGDTAGAVPDEAAHSGEPDRPLASVSRIRSAEVPRPVGGADPLVALRLMQTSDAQWDKAVSASMYPPPDAGFPHRIRALAAAAESESRAIAQAAATPGMRWKPTGDRRGLAISYELRPAANRPGPEGLWMEFDRCLERLGIAMESPELAVIAARWQDLADIMDELADALLDETRGERQRR